MLEIILMFTQMKFYKLYHPQREDETDLTIYDAEFMADVQRRLDEQRHDMAMKCVQMGIYPNIIKAKEQMR
jgi:exonuclease III